MSSGAEREAGRVRGERQRHADDEQGRADRRRDELVGEQDAARQARVRDAQVLAPDEPRQEAAAADVGERLRGPEQEQRDEDRAPMFTVPVTIVAARSARTSGARQVDDDDDPDPVDPVGDDARREPEQQHRDVLGEERHRDEQRVARLEATSSGPAASATPSPTLVRTDVASSHRNERPRRDGAVASARRAAGLGIAAVYAAASRGGHSPAAAAGVSAAGRCPRGG